MMQPTQFTKG